MTKCFERSFNKNSNLLLEFQKAIQKKGSKQWTQQKK